MNVKTILNVMTGETFEAAVFETASGRSVFQFVHNLKKDGGRNMAKRSYPLGIRRHSSGYFDGHHVVLDAEKEVVARELRKVWENAVAAERSAHDALKNYYAA